MEVRAGDSVSVGSAAARKCCSPPSLVGKGAGGLGPPNQSLMTAMRTPVMAIKVVIIHLKCVSMRLLFSSMR